MMVILKGKQTIKTKRLLLLLFLVLCLVLTGCGTGLASQPDDSLVSTTQEKSEGNAGEPAEQQPESTEAVPLDSLDAVLALANDRHRAYHKPRLMLEEYIVTAEGSDFDIQGYALDMSKEITYDGGIPVTLEQAEKDIEVLFTTLSTTYGPYHYFGGDKVFSAAKDAILESCRDQAETGELVASDVTRLIYDNLGFIRDGHFQVNFERLHQPEVAYLYTGALFNQTTDGGYLARDGRVLKSVDGRPNLDNLLSMTLTDAGEVAYCPVVLWEVDDEMTPPDDLTLRYTDGSSDTVTPDPWKAWYDEDMERTIDLTYNEGYPVVFVRNMGFDEAQDDVLGKTFLAYAEQLKDEPVVILDLRSNGGGNGVLPLKWLSVWTGCKVTTNSVGLQYFSQQDLDDFVANTENSTYNTYEDFTELMNMRPVSDQYMSITDVPDEFLERDKLLIVLTGKYTASAAEYFADAAMNVENVLLVGENTFGMIVSNAYVNIQLPNSGTIIQLGCNLMFYPDEVKEYAGILPDIWVNGDAEEQVIRMMQNLG